MFFLLWFWKIYFIKNNSCVVAYGIGRGGIEVILILGVSYFILLLALLGVDFGGEAANAQIIATAHSIQFSSACIGMFERISAMMIHAPLKDLIASSVNVEKPGFCRDFVYSLRKCIYTSFPCCSTL